VSITTHNAPRPEHWTGELALDLRNGRNWPAGDAQLSVRRDTVIVRHAGRDVANLDRQRFRVWLLQVEPEPMRVDDVVWFTEFGVTFMNAGAGSFRVTAESLSHLIAVI
jgi:hypothetical protein